MMGYEIYKFAEIKSSDSPLSEIAKSMKDKTMDISELDKPIAKDIRIIEKSGLTEEQKVQAKEISGYSDEIIDRIGSLEELQVYLDAGLVEAEGKPCLIRKDIDVDQKDEFGRTNGERIENKLSPITKAGETVVLHHIGQKSDSPLAELTTSEHVGGGNDTILHDKQKKTEIDRNEFNKERKTHWQNRSND